MTPSQVASLNRVSEQIADQIEQASKSRGKRR